jgi:hypothetical protein
MQLLRVIKIALCLLVFAAFCRHSESQGSIVLEIIQSTNFEIHLNEEASVTTDRAKSNDLGGESKTPLRNSQILSCDLSEMVADNTSVVALGHVAICSMNEFRLHLVPPLEMKILVREWFWIPDSPVLKLLKVPVMNKDDLL